MKKLREFFQNKYVMTAEAILLVLMVIGLGVAGVTAVGIEKLAALAIALTGAIDAVATFIAAFFNKQNEIVNKD